MEFFEPPQFVVRRRVRERRLLAFAYKADVGERHLLHLLRGPVERLRQSREQASPVYSDWLSTFPSVFPVGE